MIPYFRYSNRKFKFAQACIRWCMFPASGPPSVNSTARRGQLGPPSVNSISSEVAFDCAADPGQAGSEEAYGVSRLDMVAAQPAFPVGASYALLELLCDVSLTSSAASTQYLQRS